MQGKKSTKNLAKKLTTKVAEYYANVSCPLIMYQDKMPKEVMALRKRQK